MLKLYVNSSFTEGVLVSDKHAAHINGERCNKRLFVNPLSGEMVELPRPSDMPFTESDVELELRDGFIHVTDSARIISDEEARYLIAMRDLRPLSK